MVSRLSLAVLLCLTAFTPAWARYDLVSLYRLALERDAQYLAARHGAEGGREQLHQAKAALLPQLSANLGISLSDTEQKTKDILNREVTRQYDYTAESAALSLRQALYRPASLAQLRQAKAKVEGLEAQLEKERLALAMRLVTAYFEALSTRERLASLKAEQQAYAAQLEAAERAFRAGLGTRTDVDDARARLDLAQAREIEVRQALEVAQRALSALVDEPVDVWALRGLKPGGAELNLPQPHDLQAWVRLAEENNPELRAWRSALAAAEQEVSKNRAGHLPTLDLVASSSLSDSESESMIGSRYRTHRIGVQLTLPLYAGGYVEASIRQSVAMRESTRQQMEAARRQLGVEVARAYAAVTQGVAKVKALEAALQSAQQAVRSTQKGLQAGTRSRVDVLNALQQEEAIRYELYRARIDYVLGHLRLAQASGRLDEDTLRQFDAWLQP
ncbi:MAG: TolC family outer membrane protein [Thiobacillaceae bacterium]|nr:TolC family outer membrane protein [Thiobacillaceae bacterium]MDW8324043.1 TolC family outer membrane protein [Burkholderiales bacterium]